MSTYTTAQTTARADRRQLFIAAFLGLMAAILVVVFLNQADGGSTSGSAESVAILVASEPIAAGAVVQGSQLTTKNLPLTAVTDDMLSDRAAVTGKAARYPIEKGETITTARLVQPATAKSLSFQIPAGMRGMTIPVSMTNTPAALVAPGDFVDVLVSVEAVSLTSRPLPVTPDGTELRGAATLLQNIQVLSVDRKYVANGVVYDSSVRGTPPGEKDDVGFVTLAVAPDQAQTLWLAQDRGKLTIILRPFGEDNLVPLNPKLEPITP